MLTILGCRMLPTKETVKYSMCMCKAFDEWIYVCINVCMNACVCVSSLLMDILMCGASRSTAVDPSQSYTLTFTHTLQIISLQNSASAKPFPRSLISKCKCSWESDIRKVDKRAGT